MAEFMINPGLVERNIRELEEITKGLSIAAAGIQSVQNRLVVQEVGKALRFTSEEVISNRQQMEVMKNSLENIVGQYKQSEMRILMLQAVKDGNADGSQNNGEQEWYKNLDKTAIEALLSILRKAGPLGDELSFLIAVLKGAIKGDEIGAEDYANMARGLLESSVQFMKDGDLVSLNKFLGLNKLKTIVTDSSAGWFENASDTFKKTFKDKAGIRTKGVLDGLKVAKWGFTAISNTISNFKEISSGEISFGRGIAETFSETVVDLAKDAGLMAGIASISAVAGIAMPVVAVGGIAVVTSIVADKVCERITGKDLTEYMSDSVLDFVSDAAKKITGASRTAEKISCRWGTCVYVD